MQDMIDASRQPVVFVREGEVFANSRDVAAAFEKRHDNVIRDIETLVRTEPALGLRQFAGEGRALSFEETSRQVPMPNGGSRTERSYDMNRDGFTLLAMGFTGAKALKWKLRYIEAFNAMESEIRNRTVDVSAALSNPATLRSLLAGYTEKVIKLEGEVEEMRPSVQALERIAVSEGSMSVTEAAKALQVRPKDLFTFLRTREWIYRRPGASSDLAYQAKLMQGLLEHKTTTVAHPDGTEKTVSQVRVTPKGLTRLAKEMTPTDRLC